MNVKLFIYLSNNAWNFKKERLKLKNNDLTGKLPTEFERLQRLGMLLCRLTGFSSFCFEACVLKLLDDFDQWSLVLEKTA